MKTLRVLALPGGIIKDSLTKRLYGEVVKHNFLFILLTVFAFSIWNANAQRSEVTIQKKSSGAYELRINGKPKFIKGAVGDSGIDLVKKYGGNAIRSGYSKEKLDKARALGLMVLVNLPVASQRDGFNYDDTAAVRIQRDKILRIVQETKDHPAVMMWALGNELDHVPQKIYEPGKIYYNMKVWDAVNDLAKAIHEADPHHPVMTVVGSITEHKINALNKQCPDLDLLGVNEYGDLLKVPDWLRSWGWTRPYMVTEWGPTGFWQTPQTPWGYHIEETSSEKADKYKERYEGAILKDKNLCLGSFVFLWRQHQEYTHTWFGMFDKQWRETEAVDVMRYEWTGKLPANRAPRVDSMRINGKSAYDFIYISPGEKATAQVWMRDTDKNDSISYEWELLPEQTDFGYGGNGEKKPAPIDCSIEVVGEGTIRFTAPLREGAYRLFAAGYDKGNHAAYANIPIYVGEKNKPVRVLLITGGHDFAKEPFYAFIKSLQGITVTEAKHPNAVNMFRPENRNLYDVVLLYDMPDTISEQGKKDFTDCLKDGKGLIVWHHAYCSYQNWPEYQNIVGGRYHQNAWTDDKGVSHPASTYKHDVHLRVKVADPNHPVTKGIQDFNITDETYGNGTVNPDVHVLLSTDDPSASRSMAWTNRYGKAKVITILLGHDNLAWTNPDFVKLLTQAVLWVK